MDDTALQNLLASVLGAATECRSLLIDSLAVPAVLERLWLLQDSLARLVDAASDQPDDAAILLGSMQRDVITEVIDCVTVSRTSHSTNVAAVRQSRTTIRRLLTELHCVTETRSLAQPVSV